MPTHFAITPENDGECLKIVLDFREESEFCKGANSAYEIFPGSFLEVLSMYRGITKEFVILVSFRRHWLESLPLRQAQSDLVWKVAKMVQTFQDSKKSRLVSR